jgi:hypothetical protein
MHVWGCRGPNAEMCEAGTPVTCSLVALGGLAEVACAGAAEMFKGVHFGDTNATCCVESITTTTTHPPPTIHCASRGRGKHSFVHTPSSQCLRFDRQSTFDASALRNPFYFVLPRKRYTRRNAPHHTTLSSVAARSREPPSASPSAIIDHQPAI